MNHAKQHFIICMQFDHCSIYYLPVTLTQIYTDKCKTEAVLVDKFNVHETKYHAIELLYGRRTLAQFDKIMS